MAAPEITAHLAELTDQLAEALRAEPFSPTPGYEVGRALVRAHFTGTETLGRTVQLLSRLPRHLGVDAGEATEAGDRIARLQGALAAGYAEALRQTTLTEQEAIRQAALAAQEQAERARRDSDARFRAVFAGAAVGVAIGDTDGRLLEVNQALMAMLGQPAGEFHHRKITDFVHPEDADSLWDAISGRLLTGGEDSLLTEKRFLRRDGGTVWAHLAVSLVRDSAGRPSYLVAMGEDVSDRHELQHRLRHEATHDPLTRLPNRALLFQRLQEAYDRSVPGDRMGLCFLDLDGFKVFNDSLGHEVGDEVLTVVASRLSSCLEPEHLLARIGGDEFVLLVPNTKGPDEVVATTERMLGALAEPVAVAGHQLDVRASVGIVERRLDEPLPVTLPELADDLGAGPLDPDCSGPAELLRAADVTLHWAKSERVRRWALFDAERHASEVTRYTLSATLPAALRRGEFVVEYQPLVRLKDGALSGAEALVRWRHPRFGLLSPNRFISLAEETGAIVPLGREVLAQACWQARSWAELTDAPPFISVNLAVRQTRDPRLIEDVTDILAETGLEPAQLQLEITESAVVGSSTQPLATLHELAALGVRIAIDDFGTGYSNLVYLRQLPVHELKLAGNFVQGLRSPDVADPVDEQIVATLVSLAHTLGLTVTAEGVETAAQADRLRTIGCDTGQGWLFARPGPPERIAALLRAGHPLG